MEWTQDRLNEITSDENRANVMQVIEKYGDNKWWESDDPVRIAQYQLFEDPLMVDDFSIFHEGIEKLLDRPVWTHEFGINIDGLREEAKIAIHRREVGSDYTSISDEQRNKKIAQSIGSLYEFAAAKNQPMWQWSQEVNNMVTTINKFKDEASGKLFDKMEDACASEYKYRDIQHAFNFYDEVEDDTCSFQNGAYCVQRDEALYNRLLDTLIKCIKQYNPGLTANYIKEGRTFERDDVKGHSFIGRWLSDNSDPLYKWWYVQCNICPVCFREYGQPYYALNCKHDDSIPTRCDCSCQER